MIRIREVFKNMNKQEILKEINKTEKHLANMKKILEEREYERWKPEKRKKFYFLNSYNIAISETWDADCSDAEHYNIYNCFQTREQAETEAEKILVRRQLEDIARRLNKGNKIDYEDKAQCKFCLVYNIVQDRIAIDSDYNYVRIGVVHCLNMKFLDIAIQEIGEERLKKYLKGE